MLDLFRRTRALTYMNATGKGIRKMARQVTVFFYGLFMDPEALHARGFRPRNVRTAHVDRFRLQLGERATLVPHEGGRVHGIVMTMPHDDLDALYADDSVAAYRPEPVLAHLPDGSAEPALCFNLPTLPAATTRNTDYAVRLQSVARKMGLPESYVASIADSG
ncbi:gamma-glutamylcyclotransferase family protein [Bradyrhizobium erythrophlei]|uniref:gamma-glutamylcyclotransferase family protein n=1 Tax=Bradyrhizobium erythrophlei TaxID=1437360 RepID=UPI0035E98EF0